jgi:alpha/beta superfamily hydrolase
MSFVDIPVEHGLLEGLLWEVDSPRTAVVVCHPHPQHGGTMHNHVTYRVARAFREQGASALRFNFRGVGRSTGSYDEGRGELEDARAALRFLREKYLGLPLGAAGFSFGSRVALRLVEDPLADYVLAVGLAVNLFDFEFVKRLPKPKAFVQADADEYGPLDKVRSLVVESPPPRELFVVPNSDHLCTGRLDAFEQVATKAVAWLLDTAKLGTPRKVSAATA